MILRVFRGRIAPGAAARIVAQVRDHVYARATVGPGLRSFQTGLRETEDGSTEFVLASTWDDFDRLVMTIGTDLERPVWLRDVESDYELVSVEHYELVGEAVRGVVPLEGAILRIFKGILREDTGEGFFEFARRRQTEMLDAGLMLVSHIGRRMVGPREEATYVVLWRDHDAVRSLGADLDRPAAQEEWGRFFENWRLDGFDALTRVPPPSEGVPAVLLADDERRYIFATSSAAELLGRPVGRILGLRIEDITGGPVHRDVAELWARFLAIGELAGPFEILRPDGQTRSVGYAARANVPWPGCHASLLVDGGQPDLDDIDPALASAGIIAKYASAGR